MKRKSILYIIIAGILWGSSGIFFNILKPLGFSPLHMTAMRGGVSAILMSLHVLIFKRDCFKVSFKEFLSFESQESERSSWRLLFHGKFISR